MILLASSPHKTELIEVTPHELKHTIKTTTIWNTSATTPTCL